jgi:hypothetical protein
MQAYNKILLLEQFSPAGDQLNILLKALTSEASAHLEHGAIEELIGKEGSEFLRRLLQGYLDGRSRQEQQADAVIGSDGIIRNHHRQGCQRGLMTRFGEVTVTRIGYSARNTKSLFPMDAELNLPADKYSHGLRRLVAEEAAQKSFDEVVLSVRRTTAGKIPKLQAEQLVAETAQDFESFYAEPQLRTREPTKDPLVLSTDGKGIVMRHDSLREHTRKAAEKEQHKLKTRLSPGEKSNRKRMATVATVYDVARHMRTAEEIMSTDQERKRERPRARNKRVWASAQRESLAVVGEMFDEALRRDPKQKRPWALLIDGQTQQMHNILVCIDKLKLKHPEMILDFVHVLEYLWTAAFCFEPEGNEATENWVKERALNILSGNAASVAAGIRRSATLRKLSKAARKPADICAKYLLNNAPIMQYHKYLDAGYPIATGVIEGACRHLIKDRLDITGARWCLEGAEAILKLRSLRSSGDFKTYFEYHKQQELRRNHTSCYQDLQLKHAA